MRRKALIEYKRERLAVGNGPKLGWESAKVRFGLCKDSKTRKSVSGTNTFICGAPFMLITINKMLPYLLH